MNADNFLSVPSNWTPYAKAEDLRWLYNVAYPVMRPPSHSSAAVKARRWRENLKKNDPEGYARYRAKQREYNRRYEAKRRAGV